MSNDLTKQNESALKEYIGERIGYKTMVDAFGIKSRGGNAKIKQIKEIERYYKIEKVGTKYLIVEKYEKPLDEYVDNRQSIYYDPLENIVLYALQNSQTTRNVWSVTEALTVTTLVNSNYRIGKKDMDKTSIALEVDKDYLSSFYNSTRSRFKDIFESTLKRMSNKKLIDYEEVTMICKRVANIELNEVGKAIINDGGRIQYTTSKMYTRATDDEREYILNIEKRVLNDLNCVSVTNAVANGKYYEYIYKVNSVLKKDLNIEFYYNAYSIIHNKLEVEKIVSELEKHSSVDNLNTIKVTALTDSKDKTINKDIDNKELCIDILINSYPPYKLSNLIKNVEKHNKESDLKDGIIF